MRAARTPPDPAPMTKRSTSRSGICLSQPRPRPLDFMASPLHLGAHLRHHLFRQFLRPWIDTLHRFVKDSRLLLDHFLPKPRLVESEHVFELRFREARRIAPGSTIE